MHVLVHAGGHVEIDNQLDTDQVQASSQDPCAHHNVIVSFEQPLSKTATKLIMLIIVVAVIMIEHMMLTVVGLLVLLLHQVHLKKECLKTLMLLTRMSNVSVKTLCFLLQVVL